MAAWGAKADRKLLNALGEAGRFSIAQAEYYFDHPGSTASAEWLWDLRWTARLKRFRLPERDTAQKEERRIADGSGSAQAEVSEYGGLPANQSTEEACSGVFSNCTGVNDAIDILDRLVIH